MHDVLDWPIIPLGTFKESQMYKNVEPYFNENIDIDTVIGHSAGASAALELERNFKNRQIKSVTYNAPVFERASTNIIDDIRDDHKPMRFANGWDPVSMFDMNARTTYKPREINLDIIKTLQILC